MSPARTAPRPERPSSFIDLPSSLALAIGFTTMAHRSGFAVFYPAMVADRGWSVSEVTAAFSMSMLIYVPAVVATGQLVDRLGVRATMLLGMTLLAGGLSLVALAQELWQLYLLYAVAVGIGSPAVGYVPMLKLLSLRAGSRLGLGLGLFNAGQGVGALLISPLVQVIVTEGGWRAGAFSLGVIALVALGPLILLGAPGREPTGGAGSGGRSEGGHRAWRQPAFWLMLVNNAMLGYLLLLPAHQVAHFLLVGYPDVLAAGIGGLMGACIGIGALLGGWCLGRWSLDRLGIVGAGLVMIGVLAMLGSRDSALWIAALYAVGSGFGRGILGVNTAAFQARVFAGPTLGRVTGQLDLGFGLGAFAGPQLVALSYDLTGSYGPGLATAIVAGWVSALVTWLALASVRRRSGQA